MASPVAKSLAARASARSWMSSFITASVALRAAAGPFGAAGAVFERDAGGGEAVADLVGDGEVFVLAGGCSQVDHERHEFGDQVVGTGGCRRRLLEDAEDAREFF